MGTRLVLFFIFFLSMLFSQSVIDRFRVPLIIKTKVGFGYDSNFLRLSNKDIDDGNAYAFGVVSTVDSPVFKPYLGFILSPLLFKNHKTNVMSSFSYSYYNNAQKKSYLISNFSFELKLKSYSWFKFGVRDVPKFYIRNFIDRDDVSSEYKECSFASRKYFLNYSIPLKWFRKMWIKAQYEQISEFYNSHFTEFDLKKEIIQLELNHKMKNNNSIKLAINSGRAENINFNNSNLVSTYIDRSYFFESFRLSFIIRKHGFRQINRFGFSNYLEQRNYDLFLAEEDKLYGLNWKHVVDEWKYYLDGRANFWIDWKILDDISVKTSYQYRWRDTKNENFGNLEWIGDAKEYDKHEFWLEFSFKFITDFLY